MTNRVATFGTLATILASSATALADGAPCAASIAPGHGSAVTPIVTLTVIAAGAIFTLVRSKKK